MNLTHAMLNNLFSFGYNIFSNKEYQLSYVAENKDWVIKQIGREIVSSLNRTKLLRARITTSHLGIKNQIIHFGSANTFFDRNGFPKPHQSNKLVLTWFHFVPEDKKNKNIIKAQNYLNFIHTACNITKNNLLNLGVNSEKIVVIPLGVDLSLFKPVSLEEKQKIKARFGMPPDKIVIGSFQKDGVGWREGLEPKLIKGPDIFVEVVEKLAKNYPILILLVGPARGYIKNELQKRNIPYKSVGLLKDFKEIAKYYHVLDLYLITSRVEGGPKQILEAMASGIPLVSTKVGMVEDIAKDSKEILLAEIENVNQIVAKSEELIQNGKLKDKLIESGLSKVQNYSWQRIVKEYYDKIYSKIL